MRPYGFTYGLYDILLILLVRGSGQGSQCVANIAVLGKYNRSRRLFTTCALSSGWLVSSRVPLFQIENKLKTRWRGVFPLVGYRPPESNYESNWIRSWYVIAYRRRIMSPTGLIFGRCWHVIAPRTRIMSPVGLISRRCWCVIAPRDSNYESSWTHNSPMLVCYRPPGLEL